MSDQPAWFTALAWQNGARWFAQQGGVWKVDMSDPKTTQVAEFWQKLISAKQVVGALRPAASKRSLR
jgi:multiple sugar transport system substrate-binding protein